MIFKYFFIFFIINISASSQTNLESYFEGILENDLTLKTRQQQLKIVNSQYLADKTTLRSEISGRASTDSGERDYNVNLSQNLFLGGSFNLSYIENPTGKDYSVEYVQQLANNSFGYTDLIRKRRSRQLLDAEKIFLTNYYADLCKMETKRYMDTLALQKTVDISKQSMNDAERALDAVTKGYNQKLITRNDFLSAKTDYLETKQSFLDMKANLELQKKSMSLVTKRNIENLTEPKPVDNFENSEFENKIKAIELQVKASKLDIKLLPSYKKPNVGLFVRAGRRNYSLTSKTLDDYLMTGIDLSWPVFNRNHFEAVKQSYYQYEIANINLDTEKQNQQIQKLTIESLLSILKTKIETLNQVIKNSKEQLKIAFSKLKLGQIEFEGYLLIRDKLNRELIDLINSSSQYYNENLNKLIINNKLPSYCKA